MRGVPSLPRWRRRSTPWPNTRAKIVSTVSGMVGEVEFFADAGFRQGGADFRVGRAIPPGNQRPFPDPHGVALHEAVGILAADAGLGEREQHALGMDQARTC